MSDYKSNAKTERSGSKRVVEKIEMIKHSQSSKGFTSRLSDRKEKDTKDFEPVKDKEVKKESQSTRSVVHSVYNPDLL